MEGTLAATIGRVVIVGVRVGTLMAFAPFFSSTTISPRAKAGFTVALTAVLYPAIAARVPELSAARAWQIAGGEFIVGLIMGITLQFVFEGVELAGQIVGFQIGHSLANLINPLSEAETPILSNLYQILALLVFLQCNVHHWLLRGVAKSFEYCPPGSIVTSAGVASHICQAAGGMLIIAIQIAVPVLVATIIIDLALGFLGRASPQLPVLFVGISVKSFAALLVIIGTLQSWPGILERRFLEAVAQSEQVLHLAR